MTTERIVTEYTADTRSFTSGTNRYARQLAAHERVVNRRLDQIDQRWERSARAVGVAATALIGLGSAAAALSEFRSLAEEWRGVERALAAIGVSGAAAESALVDLAIRTRSDVSGTAAAVQRLAKSTGGDLDETIRRVETLQKLLAFGGASGGERASVSLQLGQALQAGVLSGDEYKSIAENAPAEFLDALAASAGVARSELKSVAADQRLTTDIVLSALDALATTADASFGALAVSGEEAVAVLRAGLVAYVGQVDESLGATAVLNGAMVGLGEYLSGAGEGAQTLAAALQIIAGAAAGLATSKGIGAISTAFTAAAEASRVAAAEAQAATVQAAEAEKAAAQGVKNRRAALLDAQIADREAAAAKIARADDQQLAASEKLRKASRGVSEQESAVAAARAQSASAQSGSVAAAEKRLALSRENLAAAQADLDVVNRRTRAEISGIEAAGESRKTTSARAALQAAQAEQASATQVSALRKKLIASEEAARTAAQAKIARADAAQVAASEKLRKAAAQVAAQEAKLAAAQEKSAAAQAKSVAAAERKLAVARQSLAVAQADLNTANSQTRATITSVESSGESAKVAKARNALAAAESNLAAAQARLSLVTRVSEAAVRGFNGVMAFFGGPIGLAITAAGALAVAISRIPTSAEKIESSLNIASDAASRFESAMSAVSSVDADLAQAKNDMAAASATYRAAVADEATVAAATAQAEVSAINTRIAALEDLRAARLAEARVAALDAQTALSEASEPLRQEVRADITPRNSRNGRADQGPSEAEITSALDARIEAIGAELAAGADLSDQDRVIARAAAEAQATAAKIELLSQALERAASVDPSAVDPAPGGSGISDLLDGANLASRRLAALEAQAARLRGALAEGSLDDSTAAEAREALAGVETDIARLRTSDVGDAGLSRLLDSASLASRQLSELRAKAATLRTALDSGDLDATTAREAREALTGIEETIRRLRDGAASGSGSGGAVTLVDGDQITSLQDAEQLLARLSEQAQTQSERRAEQARRVAEARIVLVARYGEESDAVARLDEATRRLNNSGASAAGALANMLATTALQAKNLEDGLKQVLVQLLQMNGVDAFTQLFSGAGEGFLSTLFGGSGGGGASGEAFAGGGIMTGAGRVPLRAYSSGGIARSAQLALFGEGRKPEAYVPLPDGKTIPVTIRAPIAPIMPVSPGAQASGSTTVFAPVNHFHGVTGSMVEIESMVTRVTKAQTEKAIARQKREGLI